MSMTSDSAQTDLQLDSARAHCASAVSGHNADRSLQEERAANDTMSATRPNGTHTSGINEPQWSDTYGAET